MTKRAVPVQHHDGLVLPLAPDHRTAFTYYFDGVWYESLEKILTLLDLHPTLSLSLSPSMHMITGPRIVSLSFSFFLLFRQVIADTIYFPLLLSTLYSPDFLGILPLDFVFPLFITLSHFLSLSLSLTFLHTHTHPHSSCFHLVCYSQEVGGWCVFIDIRTQSIRLNLK